MSSARAAITAALLAAFAAMAAAQPATRLEVPWPDGETLTFDVRYSGINVAIQTVVASRVEDGWRFEAELRPNAIMALFYNASGRISSRVDTDLVTISFRKVTEDPHLGRRVLTVSTDGNGRAHMDLVEGDGSRFVETFSAANLVDEVSLGYLVRVLPESADFTAIDYYRLVTGTIERLPARTVSVPWGTAPARGYAFSQGETKIEAWVQADPPRYPLRVSYGQGWGSVTAVLRKAQP